MFVWLRSLGGGGVGLTCASCGALTPCEQHLTWMRRQSNEMAEVVRALLFPPFSFSSVMWRQITEEYERGSFIFFDYENGCVPALCAGLGRH
jgi:hypothetical protein